MAKTFKPSVATSNHLLEGDVIYFDGGGWTRNLTDAKVARTAEQANELLTKAQNYPLETVGAVLTEVDISTGLPTPNHFREVFRTKGPSNYFHGKQEHSTLTNPLEIEMKNV